jgi:hypothetical protein
MALRRIPAVEFAFAKIGSLLRRRTNTEQIVASEFVAPASEGVTDVVAPDASEREPAESAHTDTVDAELPAVDPVGSDAVEIEAVETGRVEIETAEANEAESTSGELDPLGADENSETVSIEPLPDEAVAIDPAGIDAVETAPIDVEAATTEIVASDAAEPAALSTVATDDIALPEVRLDAFAEREVSLVEVDRSTADLAAADPVEIAASETPSIALDTVETEVVDTGAVDAAPIETAAASIDDVTPLPATLEDHCETRPAAVAALPAAKPDESLDREALIRRRWKETGIMMWHGAGQSVLCIQGSAKLLPPKAGETMPQYDRLEFRLIDGLIVCEGFVVDAPAPLKNRPFARAA